MTHTDAIRKINEMMEGLDAIEEEFPEAAGEENETDHFIKAWVGLETIRTNLRQSRQDLEA